MGQTYHRMEDQKLGPGLAHNQDFDKWKRIKPKKSFPKISNVVSKHVLLKSTTAVTG